MFSGTSSPTAFLRAYGVTMIIILTLYMLFILVPSYWSGMNLLTETAPLVIMYNYKVPFYTSPPILISYDEAARLLLLIFALVYLLTPLISIVAILYIISNRSVLSFSQKMFWFTMIILIFVGIIANDRAANIFIDWFTD